VVVGILRGIAWQPQHPVISQGLHDVCGTVGAPSESMSHGYRVVIESLVIDEQKVWGRLQVYHNRRAAKAVGRRLCFSSKIKPIKNYGIPGEFDTERYYLSRKVWGRVSLNKKAKLRISKSASFYPIQKARERYATYLDQFERGYVLKALVLGLQSDIPKQIKENFIRSGLIHLLVISGQNIALVMMMIFFGLGWLLTRSDYLMRRYTIPKVNLGISFVFVIIFCLFSGAEIPIVRAAIMSFCMLMAYWHSRPNLGIYTLTIALAFILNFIPSSLYDPSFQLSFLAIIGLMLIPKFCRSPLRLLVFATVAATLMTTPVIMYHFQRISLISLFSNLFVMPLVGTILLPLSYCITFAFFISESLSTLLMPIFNLSAQLFLYAAQYFGSFSWSSVYVNPPSLMHTFYMYGVGGVLIFYLRRGDYRKLISVFCIGSAILLFYYIVDSVVQKRSQSLRISFLSVGQGDSTFIKFPTGKTMLIDAGGIYGRFDVGERLVGPFLRKQRLKRIDYVVMSHLDFDHIQGFQHILKYFSVGEIWLSQVQGKKYFYDLMVVAENKEIPVHIISRQSHERVISGVRFEFLSPAIPFQFDSKNNKSLVTKMIYKDFSILFTGDIEREVEYDIVGDLKSTILKVPHHGSKTSSSLELLRRVQPTLAVMSVGYQNRYRHPHTRVIKRYQVLGIPVWRTDQRGTLTIKTDGHGYIMTR